jgi:hypothetical protein
MKIALVASLLAALLVIQAGCIKSADMDGLVRSGCRLPHNAAPTGLKGDWASGFSSYNQIVDAFNGNIMGYNWDSAGFFSFTDNGEGAECYIIAKGPDAQTATKAIGSVEFDAGATAESGSFVFHACRARCKSWGNPTFDRNATDAELRNTLTRRYYYEMEGDVLRIEVGGPPHQNSSSFARID